MERCPHECGLGQCALPRDHEGPHDASDPRPPLEQTTVPVHKSDGMHRYCTRCGEDITHELLHACPHDRDRKAAGTE